MWLFSEEFYQGYTNLNPSSSPGTPSSLLPIPQIAPPHSSPLPLSSPSPSPYLSSPNPPPSSSSSDLQSPHLSSLHHLLTPLHCLQSYTNIVIQNLLNPFHTTHNHMPPISLKTVLILHLGLLLPINIAPPNSPTPSLSSLNLLPHILSLFLILLPLLLLCHKPPNLLPLLLASYLYLVYFHSLQRFPKYPFPFSTLLPTPPTLPQPPSPSPLPYSQLNTRPLPSPVPPTLLSI